MLYSQNREATEAENDDCGGYMQFITKPEGGGGTGRMIITSGGDVLIADSTNSVYNDSSGGGMNLKANGQIVRV